MKYTDVINLNIVVEQNAYFEYFYPYDICMTKYQFIFHLIQTDKQEIHIDSKISLKQNVSSKQHDNNCLNLNVLIFLTGVKDLIDKDENVKKLLFTKICFLIEIFCFDIFSNKISFDIKETEICLCYYFFNVKRMYSIDFYIEQLYRESYF